MSTAVATREMAMVAAPNPQEEALRRIASQQTPKGEIRERIGRGGMKLKYTDGAYVIRTLNQAFGWDWDFVADSEELLLNNGQPFEVKVRGTLTVRLDGRVITKTQFGCQPIEMLKNGTAPVSIGDCYKGAATDAMKKCASLLGIALDLYDSDYKAEKYAEPEPMQKPDTRDVPRIVPREAVETIDLTQEIADDLSSRGIAAEIVKRDGTVRKVKLEGAQPANRVIGPKTRDILNWMEEMGWEADTLANYIFMQFKIAVSDSDPVIAIDALSAGQKKALYQMIEGEFNNRNRTK